MGIFEDILASSRKRDYAPTDSAFPELTPEPDEAALAEEARQKAGERLIRANRRRPTGYEAPDAQSAGVQYEMDNVPAGTGVPFSTQAGMLAPPITVGDSPGPIPLPRPDPRKPEGDGPTDVGARSVDRGTPGAPIQIAPQQQAAPQQASDPFGLPSILDKIRTGLGNNSNTLLAIGAGLSGAPSMAQGISRAAAAAIPARAADLKQSLDTVSQGSVYKALIKAGAPEELARAAMGNPIVAKSAVETYLSGGKTEIKNIKLPDGTEMSIKHNPVTGETFDLNGNKLDLQNLTHSVVDQTLTGDAAAEAAAAANPALHKQAMAYVEGRENWPNARALKDPRVRAATDLARQIDPELTEQNAIARSVYMKDAANTKSGVGFQVKGFHQGIEHLHTMAKKIEQFAPSDGMGSADLAHLINSTKERFGESSGLARDIQAKGQAVAGEVGKLYSGQTGGGVHEREKTAGLFDVGKSSGTQLAGSLGGTIDLMEGGLRSLEQNRDRVMGEKGSKNEKLQYRNKETEARIADIRGVIARLKGEQAAAAPAAAAPAFKPGKAYKMLPDGSLVEK